MSTAHRAVAMAVLSALQQAPAVAGGRVRMPSRHPAPQEWASYVEVRLVQSDGVWPYAGATLRGQWDTAIAIDCHVRADAGQAADGQLDALLSSVAERVLTMSVPAGVSDMRPAGRIEWDWSEVDTPTAMASLQIVMRHDTATAGLTA